MKFLLSNPGDVLELFLQHLGLSFISMLIAILIAIPLVIFCIIGGNWLARFGCAGHVLYDSKYCTDHYVDPDFGLNRTSVIVALIIYCQVILVRNVLAGLDGIDPAVMEAAQGMGMDRWQIAWRVQMPLALPVILAGLRIAAISAIAISAVGAKFGAGGLENYCLTGSTRRVWTKSLLGRR